LLMQRPHSAPAGAVAAAEEVIAKPPQVATAAAHASAGRALALQRLKNRASQRQAAALSSSAELAHQGWPTQPAEAGSDDLRLAALVSAAAKTPLVAWLQVSRSSLPLSVSSSCEECAPSCEAGAFMNECQRHHVISKQVG
jgi:hypothetical protein